MIIKAKTEENTNYYIVIKKSIFEKQFTSFVVDIKDGNKIELNKHTKYNIASVLRNLKAKNYIITFEKG